MPDRYLPELSQTCVVESWTTTSTLAQDPRHDPANGWARARSLASCTCSLHPQAAAPSWLNAARWSRHAFAVADSHQKQRLRSRGVLTAALRELEQAIEQYM